MIFKHDLTSEPLTIKALERAWKELPAHSPSPWGNWQACFFLRVSFVRVLWSIRKTHRAKYLEIRTREWHSAMNAFRPHRKTWHNEMKCDK